MSLRKIFSSPFFLLQGVLKKSRFDNFVGGLIFGAIFSLLVNIATVKVQEDITRQRVLEALEREIISHSLKFNSTMREYEKAMDQKAEDIISPSYYTTSMFADRIWESPNMYGYMLEMDPKASSELQVYYDILVKFRNGSIEQINKDFEDIYEPCMPLYNLRTEQEPKDIAYCGEIIRNTLRLYVGAIQNTHEDINRVKTVFHPTRDRLNNPWLRFLLGNRAIEILK